MTDRMTPISFAELMETLLTDVKNTGKAYGAVPVAKKDAVSCPATFMGQTLDNPLGIAAGPQSQLASNILVCYLGGARVFELNTIQELAGEDLPIDKPPNLPGGDIGIVSYDPDGKKFSSKKAVCTRQTAFLLQD